MRAPTRLLAGSACAAGTSHPPPVGDRSDRQCVANDREDSRIRATGC
ncbi:hypothetical protein ACH3Y9_11290 [Streptomyces sp. WSLK1-5]